jgi:hypothetical protein
MNNDLKSNSNVKQAVPFFMVTNIDDSLTFYIKGLGFTIKHQWEPRGKIEWCWLQLDEASSCCKNLDRILQQKNWVKV